jgi:hypothetical protein
MSIMLLLARRRAETGIGARRLKMLAAFDARSGWPSCISAALTGSSSKACGLVYQFAMMAAVNATAREPPSGIVNDPAAIGAWSEKINVWVWFAWVPMVREAFFAEWLGVELRFWRAAEYGHA